MSLQDTYTKDLRKMNGVFFTPKFLSDYLAESVWEYSVPNNIKKKLSVLDPACGDSALLKAFTHCYRRMTQKNIGLEIIGFDKDPNAIAESKQAFKNCVTCGNVSSQFINTDAFFPSKGRKILDSWLKLFKSKSKNKSLNVILSNPPWGADLSVYSSNLLSERFTLAKGQFDSYDIFAEMIIRELDEEGIYGLIIPDSIFNQEHVGLRKILIEQTQLLLIARLGEKIFNEINRACAVIIGIKRKPNPDHMVRCFRLNNGIKKKVLRKELSLKDAELELMHYVPQTRFANNKNYILDIDTKKNELKTLFKLSKYNNHLKDYVSNFRGVELSKKGQITQCPQCKKWMPQSKSSYPVCLHCGEVYSGEVKHDKIIVEEQRLNESWKNIVVGEDIYRYTLRNNKSINVKRKGINYKDASLFNGKKILVRKTGIGITAALDYNDCLTNQVVYVLKRKQGSPLPLEVVLAILNSRAMTYYLIMKYGENEWRSHPYLTQTMLKNLPFPNIDLKNELNKKIIRNMTRRIRKEVANVKDKNISDKTDIFIERAVAKFYKLNLDDYKRIFKCLESAEQLIPIKRLLNTTPKEIMEYDGL